MPTSPETRESLILRLPTQSDAQAWREFVEIYEPLLFRFARRRGLQEADAREIAQNVFVAVAKAVDRWEPNQERGRFRAWLFRIARNQVINTVSKHRRDRASGRTAEIEVLKDLPNREEFDEVAEDYRREMFRLAAAQVRESFHANTWDAFWKSSVLARPVEEVAKEVGISTGAVYIAKSRVIAKIKSVILQWEQEDAL